MGEGRDGLGGREGKAGMRDGQDREGAEEGSEGIGWREWKWRSMRKGEGRESLWT